MSGRTALQVGGAVVGAVVGFFVGGGPAGAVYGATLGAGIGGIAGAIIYQPDPIHQHGPRLLDVRPTTSQYGNPINYVWGTMRVAGEVIWQTDLQEIGTTQTFEGGKGGGDAGSSTTYSYWAAFAVRVAKAPHSSFTYAGIRKMWVDGALVYDRSPDAGGSSTSGQPFVLYLGSTSQSADPTMEQWLGAGNVPGQRGDCYVVFPQQFLDLYGRRIPNINFEICSAGTSYPAAADSFDRANAYPLDGNWVSLSGGDPPDQYRISGNKVAWESGGSESGARWLYPASLTQYQEIVLSGTVTNGSTIQIYNRVALTSGSISDGIVATVIMYSLNEQYVLQPYSGGPYYSFTTTGGDSNLVRNMMEQSATGTVTLRFDSSGTTHTLTANGVVIAQATTSNHNTSNNVYQGFGQNSPTYYFEAWAGGSTGLGGTIQPLIPSQVALSTVVSDICVMAGLTTGQIDVTALAADYIDGFLFRGPAPARQALEQLMRVYRFDAVESGGKVRFVKRGNTSMRVLGVEDLGYAETPEGSPPLTIERTETLGLPKQIELGYFSAAADYQVVTQYSRRLSGGATENSRIDFPLVLSDQKAKELADVVLYSSWEGRELVSTQTWHRHLDLEPTDVVTLDDGAGVQIIGRVTRTDYGVNGLIKLMVAAEQSLSYTPSTQVSTIGGGGNTGQTVTLPEYSDAVIFEAPMLLVDSNAPELWAAGYSNSGAFTPIDVQRSTDGGTTYASILTITSPTAVGTAVTVLATADTAQIDWKNTVEVSIGSQYTLSSVTIAQMREGANVMLVGDEVIAFATATLISAGRWRLSGLIRGLRGTEWAVSGHVVSEQVVLLSSAIRRIALTTTNIGQTIMLRWAPQGASEYVEVDRTLLGTNMKPLSVASVAAGRGADGAIGITWVRRSRLAQGWTSAEVPMDEAAESYELEVWNSGRTSRLRLVTGLSAGAYTYSAADQITDFGSIQSSVNLSIYMIGSAVGRGYEKRATV